MILDSEDDAAFGPGKVKWHWWAAAAGVISLGYLAVIAFMMKMVTGVAWLDLPKVLF